MYAAVPILGRSQSLQLSDLAAKKARGDSQVIENRAGQPLYMHMLLQQHPRHSERDYIHHLKYREGDQADLPYRRQRYSGGVEHVAYFSRTRALQPE